MQTKPTKSLDKDRKLLRMFKGLETPFTDIGEFGDEDVTITYDDLLAAQERVTRATIEAESQIGSEIPNPQTTNVTRVEVIDEKGRSYVNWKPNNKVELSPQDEGRTLKIFISQTK